MNQTLKISIARGGCRFATPLYLGGSYVLTFDGERSNEADSCVITKPRSTNPNDSTGIDGLAQTVRSGTTLTLALNKQVLLDWFKDNGACDIDGSVDAHCYILNSSGDVIADSDISIEYRPIDFVIDTTSITHWEVLNTRVTTLESQSTSYNNRLNGHDTNISSLTAADAANLITAANDATAKAEAALVQAKAYADSIRSLIIKMQYVRDVNESTETEDKFRKVEAIKDDTGSVVLQLSEELYNAEEGAGTANYMFLDRNQTVSGDKTHTGEIYAKTQATSDNSTKVANTAWVVAKLASWWDTIKTALLGESHTWGGTQTFSNTISGTTSGNLPLSGGTMTGGIKFANGNYQNNQAQALTFGIGNDWNTGSSISLYGDDTEYHSRFELRAHVSDTTNKTLIGRYDGTLKWDNKHIVCSSTGSIIWVGTEAEYNAITTKDSSTFYFVKES